MHPFVELNLSLILLLPWFAILGTLFWWLPRRPRSAARIAFDIAALLVALAAVVASIHWAHAGADPAFGRMWRQVLATAVGYGVFLAVLGIAFAVRWRWIGRGGADL